MHLEIPPTYVGLTFGDKAGLNYLFVHQADTIDER